MNRSQFPILPILLLTLALTACETGTPDDTQPTASAPPTPVATAPAAPTATPPPTAFVATPAPTTTATAHVGQTIGVPACDEYVAAYRSCLTSGKVKGEQRNALRLALQDQMRAWQSGSVPDLVGACTTARTVARNTFAQYGCDKL